ncbi:MAG: alcohol dehydrogenase catalytic domain-containing protein [bacterium]|nr:alcohol dehydrogenase catalytic domain-containing protein [bacterium]
MIAEALAPSPPRSHPPRLRVARLPPSTPVNPYQTLLYRHLREEGVELAGDARLELPWLLQNRGRVDVLHFHWRFDRLIDRRAQGDLGGGRMGSGRREALVGALRVAQRLALARLLGYRIAWTIHDVANVGPDGPLFERSRRTSRCGCGRRRRWAREGGRRMRGRARGEEGMRKEAASRAPRRPGLVLDQVVPRPVAFAAPEYQPDGSIAPARYAFAGSSADGWTITREGREHLRLGPGYRLLETSHCGICATDLARRHLPFPLPQITGHEAVARDEGGQTVVVEINASHAARGLPHDAWCAHCRAGMPSHCPDRLVLGIHDLPGGFSPWMLAPVDAILPVPAALSPRTTTLVEPFAAALHAVHRIGPRARERIAVLGPGRLGSLVVAALAAWRRRARAPIGIVAVGRRSEALARARALGADETLDVAGLGDATGIADVVVETTGSPDGLALALRLATRAVHVKSTTGQPSLGLRHLTELVVDEVGLLPWRPGEPLPPGATSAAVHVRACRRARRARRGGPAGRRSGAARALPLGGADLAVAADAAEADAMLRPEPGVERGAVRARGTILCDGDGDDLVGTLARRRVELGSSRCGDFRAALDLLVDPSLAEPLGARLVGDVVPAERLADGFARAAAPGAGKVLVAHPGTALGAALGARG